MSHFAVTFLTLFPEMFPGPLGHSLSGAALRDGIWSLETLNIRDFATDRHKTVDDTPYGGGAGMVLKPDVIDAAITAAKARNPDGQLVYMTPRGIPLAQKLIRELLFPPHSASPHCSPLKEGEEKIRWIILCGRFEAVDERVLEHHKPLEISLGDFVLSGGEIAAMALVDACVRLLPGVMGDPVSLAEESFGEHDYAGLLEYPHYTRPPLWKGSNVPEVLLSGNHAEIEAWRKRQAEEVTRIKRPDLWKKYKG
jgi:tRNA (guanine37-N1)-methyltransferase